MNTLSVENNRLIVNLRLSMSDLKFLVALVNGGPGVLFANDDHMWQNAGGVAVQLQKLGVIDSELNVNADAILLNVTELTQD